MTLKKILVAFDGSDLSKKALNLALDIARPNPEIHLDVVYAATLPAFAITEASGMQAVIDAVSTDGEEVLDQARAALGDRAHNTEAILARGVYPANEILILIESGNYDLVIIGSRGLSGIKEHLGSMSYKILHGSTAPVLIAK
ncbi:MAG: universal stress protein [Raoultibacter sp.]